MRRLKDFLKNPEKYRLEDERERAKELQKLTHADRERMTRSLLDDKLLTEMIRIKIDSGTLIPDNPRSLALSLKANGKKHKRR